MKVTREEVIQKIGKYLKGESSKREAYEWSSNILRKAKHGELDKDIEDALWELWGLHNEDDRFDTAKEDLEKTLKKLQTGKIAKHEK
jgi:cobalamin biosynthesis Mg chelatase CobN